MIDQLWANEAIRQCIALGVDHFFLAPGSRCTPLTLAVAKNESANITQHFDERGLAFAALGYGRATGKAGVFICTSGTAVANAFPAVIEAAMEGVPLLLFTADRPPELRGTGANQTIEQRHIFGDYTRAFQEMPVPYELQTDDDPDGRMFIAEMIGKGVSVAKYGPVHLNWMFREPFTIDDSPAKRLADPYDFAITITEEPLDSSAINTNGNTLIALGGCRSDEARAAIELAEHLNCPMLSDVTSGIRNGSFELVSQFKLPTPDTIVHLGGRIVSKAWLKWTATLKGSAVRFIHVSPTGQTINPNHLDIEQHTTPLEHLVSKFDGESTSDEFGKAWQASATARDDALFRCLANEQKLSEPAVAYHLGENCPQTHAMFLGNSTPIRDMDWFSRGTPQLVRPVAANRGASGIDGLLATAVGYANGLQQPTTVLLGDLSALHDLNSLALVKKSQVPLVILINNNQGGHIFDLLPVAKQTTHFEQYFATPHEIGFEHAAKMFGLNYERAADMLDFGNAYESAVLDGRSIVIELATDRQYNMEVRQRVNAEIQRCSDEI